jgi:hypothetical protein
MSLPKLETVGNKVDKKVNRVLFEMLRNHRIIFGNLPILGISNQGATKDFKVVEKIQLACLLEVDETSRCWG